MMIIIVIIIFINCNWVIAQWQWLFYMYKNLKKEEVQTWTPARFNSGVAGHNSNTLQIRVSQLHSLCMFFKQTEKFRGVSLVLQHLLPCLFPTGNFERMCTSTN
jgi:hypothetical protein